MVTKEYCSSYLVLRQGVCRIMYPHCTLRVVTQDDLGIWTLLKGLG